MGSKIRVLSDHTINQIKAGEVIGEPASVVKELVENALDAGAKKIQIDVLCGGRQLIRVVDDGFGMSEDDALLCLERHATSKLREANDLFSLGTLGFRGEAIPSIASISKFSLLTKENGKEKGTLVLVEGGKLLKAVPAPCQEGTTIEVKELFFNVPVRKKFQRSQAADFREIIKVIHAFSLSYETVSFTLNHDGKLCFHTPALMPLEKRLDTVLGETTQGMGAFFQLESDGYELKGWLSFPALTRRNRTGQFLFINGRLVTSNLVSYAIKEGFGPMLPSERYPLFALFLTVPKENLDVNVHPQKREIRLHHELHVKQLCQAGVLKALEAPEVLFETPLVPAYTFASTLKPVEEETSIFSFSQTPLHFRAPLPKDTPFSFVYTPTPPRVLATIDKYFFIDRSPDGTKRGLFAVDQQAMQASVWKELFIKKDPEKETGQLLVTPLSITLSMHDFSLLKEHLSLFEAIGFSLREFGKETFLIEAAPQRFSIHEVKEALFYLLEALAEGKDPTTTFTLSAASWIQRKHTTLTEDVALALTKQWISVGTPRFSPKGTPILLELSSDQLDVFFSKS